MANGGVKVAIQSIFIVGFMMLAPAAIAADAAYDKLDKGPKVGAAIPQPLDASDQNGTKQGFSSLVGDRGLVILFSRSFDW
ncbi:MAG: hypothetical protein AAF942_03505 [Pseudomonadota bacterium]